MIEDRTSFVASAVTHVGNVRPSNQDAHWVDYDLGSCGVCDGMGGHAAGEVASAIASKLIRERWSKQGIQEAVRAWGMGKSPEVRRTLFAALRAAVVEAHDKIASEAAADPAKAGMGTTFVGFQFAGNEAVFSYAGDSRAYLVRGGTAFQLTEDHTLANRMIDAGVDGAAAQAEKYSHVLTNALGLGERLRVASFAMPVVPGDRFLLCTDGVTEYATDEDVAQILTTQPSPSRAAQRLVDLALERGGEDNATALVVKVIETAAIGATPAQVAQDDGVLAGSPFLNKLSLPRRLRFLRITTTAEFPAGAELPALRFGDQVAWLILAGVVERGDAVYRAGDVVYPELLLADRTLTGSTAQTRSAVRLLGVRRDDFADLTVEEPDLAEILFQALAFVLTPRPKTEGSVSKVIRLK